MITTYVFLLPTLIYIIQEIEMVAKQNVHKQMFRSEIKNTASFPYKYTNLYLQK